MKVGDKVTIVKAVFKENNGKRGTLTAIDQKSVIRFEVSIGSKKVWAFEVAEEGFSKPK